MGKHKAKSMRDDYYGAAARKLTGPCNPDLMFEGKDLSVVKYMLVLAYMTGKEDAGPLYNSDGTLGSAGEP